MEDYLIAVCVWFREVLPVLIFGLKTRWKSIFWIEYVQPNLSAVNVRYKMSEKVTSWNGAVIIMVAKSMKICNISLGICKVWALMKNMHFNCQ